MPTYTCNRCNYTTTRLCNLHTHINRTNVCEATNEDVPIEQIRQQYNQPVEKAKYDCQYCNKEYLSSSGLSYHVKRCQKTPTVQSVIFEQVLAQKDAIIQDMRVEIERLQSLAKTNPSVSADTINVNNDNSIHIHINNFGSENKEYITRDFAIKCFDKGANGIFSMLDQIFFNEEHTENHNVRLRSLNNRLVEVMNEKKWVTKGLNDTVGQMINISSNEIIKEAFPVARNTHSVDDVLTNMNEIQVVESKANKHIREKTIAKLVNRGRSKGRTVSKTAQEHIDE